VELSTPKRVFVVSPIGAPGTDIYKRAAYALKFIFRRALPAPEWDVHRADEGKLSDSIGQHVIRSIVKADLVIADLTGHNPNVFYELAVAHAFKKPVVHLISKGERLPFDVFDQRTIHYDISDLESVEEAVDEVRAYAEEVLEKSAEVVNPLTNYEAFDRIRDSNGTGEGASGAVADLLEQIVARLSNLEQTVAEGRTRREPRTTEPRLIYTEEASAREREMRRRLLLDEAARERALAAATMTVEDLGRITKERMDMEDQVMRGPRKRVASSD
jgi:nucleoside 2-deoxyribosyltransferase